MENSMAEGRQEIYDKTNLDTREYKLQLLDGSMEVYSANIIAENIFSQMDGECNLFTLLNEIRYQKHTRKYLFISFLMSV